MVGYDGDMSAFLAVRQQSNGFILLVIKIQSLAHYLCLINLITFTQCY